MTGAAPPAVAPAAELRVVTRAEEVDGLRIGDLSDFFNPFLPLFMKEALRCGGEVCTVGADREVSGLFLYHDVEKEASIFTRDRRIAEALFGHRGQVAVFSDFELAPGAEAYDIYAADHPAWRSSHRFAHPVRAAEPADGAAVVDLMREVYGRVDERWLGAVPSGPDRCFVADGAGELAGAGWVAVANGHGRLHSLTVRPRYRRSGVGKDLFHARVQWTRHVGAVRVISEISTRNAESRGLAEWGGMRPVGRIYRSARP